MAWEGLRTASQPESSFVLRAAPLFAQNLHYGDQVVADSPHLKGALVPPRCVAVQDTCRSPGYKDRAMENAIELIRDGDGSAEPFD